MPRCPIRPCRTIIEETAAKAGIKRREISNEEILERTLYALVNEGANILAEGIALRAVDIDMLYILGYGFPAFRGGPMWYADTVGLKKVYDKVCQFEKEHGSLWEPSPLAEGAGRKRQDALPISTRSKGS